STHGTPEASACAETGMTVSGVAVASRKSTLSCWTSCEATAAARAEEDWLSWAMISTEYFLPPMVRPLASAMRTWPSTYPFDGVTRERGRVAGLMKPILMVPPAPAPPDEAGEEAVFSELEQPASPPPAAMPAAAPAAVPRKPRLLRRPLLLRSVICFSPAFF